jgi:hypothetical protein
MKFYLNLAHQVLSNNIKGKFQFLRNFQLWFQFNFREEIIQSSRTFFHRKSKRYGTKPMHPSSSRAFQRDQERELKHPGSLDLISTKQNKTNYLASYIDCSWLRFFSNSVSYFHSLALYQNSKVFVSGIILPHEEMKSF